MELVIPHDYVRIFTYNSSTDYFEESSRLELPVGMVEWEFPEWSTDVDYATAVLQSGNLKYRLHAVAITPGIGAPAVLQITPDDATVTFSHLYVAP
jgi:hypothetical protein